MAKNLSTIIKGQSAVAGGSGIKGTWNCTPVVGDDYVAVDSYNASFDPITKKFTTDFTNVTVNQGVPVVGVVKTDLTFGALAPGQAKRLTMRVGTNFQTNRSANQNGYYIAGFFPPSVTSAEQAASAVLTALQTNNFPTSSWFQLIALENGVPTFITIGKFAGDVYPAGAPQTVSIPFNYFDLSNLGNGSVFNAYIKRQNDQIPDGDPFVGNILLNGIGLFDNLGQTMGGGIGSFDTNVIINPLSTLFIIGIGITTSGADPKPIIEFFMDDAAGALLIDATDVVQQGSQGPTVEQEAWDLFYPGITPAFVPVTQAVFPEGAAINDQYRVLVEAPYLKGEPYGTAVVNNTVVVIDNVDTGEEKFRAIVDTDLLALKLQEAATNSGPAIMAAGERSGEMTFFVKSLDVSLEPIIGANVFDDFPSAYAAAITQPKHIVKYIVIDDRSTQVQAEINAKTTGDNVWELAGNNIRLAGLTMFKSGKTDQNVRPGNSGYLQRMITLTGYFDALHLYGGAFRVRRGDPSMYDGVFCVVRAPTELVDTPNGQRQALELGDNTQLLLSALSFNFNNWYQGEAIRCGKDCAITLFADCSSNSTNSNIDYIWGSNFANGDYYHWTPGRINHFPFMNFTFEENGSFILADGQPGDIGSSSIKITTQFQHGTVDFNGFVNAEHIQLGAPTAGLPPDPTNKPVVTVQSINDLPAITMAAGYEYIVLQTNTIYNIVTLNLPERLTLVMCGGTEVRGTADNFYSIISQNTVDTSQDPFVVQRPMLVMLGGGNTLENLMFVQQNTMGVPCIQINGNNNALISDVNFPVEHSIKGGNKLDMLIVKQSTFTQGIAAFPILVTTPTNAGNRGDLHLGTIMVEDYDSFEIQTFDGGTGGFAKNVYMENRKSVKSGYYLYSSDVYKMAVLNVTGTCFIGGQYFITDCKLDGPPMKMDTDAISALAFNTQVVASGNKQVSVAGVYKASPFAEYVISSNSTYPIFNGNALKNLVIAEDNSFGAPNTV